MSTETRSWWYVIHTKPKQEARALLNLSNQGYECFLPMHKKQVVRRAAVVTQAEPLFSRYLFIQLGVSKLVVFGNEPARVDSGLIHLFKQRELSVADEVTPLFKTGDQVVIAQGPFAGLNATFQMSDGEMRAMVLIEVLNQVSKLKLPLADLRRVA
jgi:transcriptional antiterminator RfaH